MYDMFQYTVVMWYGKRMLRIRHSGEGSFNFGQSNFVTMLD